jgi:signal transduction histidine kinase
MSAPELIERLSTHKLIGSAPAEELAWIASRGTFRALAKGEILTRKDVGHVDGLFIVLSGHVVLYVDRGAGRRRVMEWRGGDVTGLLPYSRLQAAPGDTVAEEATEMVVVDRDDLREMVLACHEVTSRLVHLMVDRARAFTSSDLHDEKMVSLGKLAAGLAHELNNPASALARAAKLLQDRVTTLEAASRSIGAFQLAPSQLAQIDEVHDICLATREKAVRSPLEQADREDAIADWLEDHGADPSGAEPLAETAITTEALDRLAGNLEGQALEVALRWVAAGCSARRLASEIEEAAARISGLVSAVKGFTHMDQAAVPEAVDVGRGLTDTLAVLKSKARAKALGVVLEVEPDLPPVRGLTGELNQVWANLIDNALDAARESGRVEIKAARNGGQVLVRVIDDGPGIPPEERERIFDPFFTTKPVGQGTGLGLDIARRLVRSHHGEIEFESEPGRTEFRVALPVENGGGA